MALPPIMAFLWAEIRNLSARDLVDVPELTALIEYTLIFYIGAESGMASLMKLNGALTARFGSNYTKQKHMNEELDVLVARLQVPFYSFFLP